VETESELRKVLETTSFRNEDEPYVQEDHFDAEWAETVMRKFLMYYENHNEPLKRSHLESWYDINVWSHIVDHGLSDIFGIEVVRKESTSDAYGAIEVGKNFDETKLLADGFKISKAMHDIFVCLCRLVNLEETKIRKLQIPGILHLGLKSQVLQMSSPKGYITILKHDKLLEVPATIEKIKDLIRVLVSIWKKMIKDNMKIVFTVQNPNDFKRELLGEESPDGIDIPCHSDKEKGITSNSLPKIEYSSTQPESSIEPETSTTSLSQDIIHDDSAEILDFLSLEKSSETISEESTDSNHVTEIPESSSESIPTESQVSDSSSSEPSQENDQDESKTRSSASSELPEAK
ncbi:20252_t:CDS:2, partial [Racocetra persica]